ncbi:MAG: dipeptide epimerase [Saprospiraceae bacterium]|nr:MAG: dipeptide epimerase [Saprospiraceae bacterium]
MKLKLHPFTLVLNEPFTISRGSYSQRKALFVELLSGDKSGFGEASEHAYYGVNFDDLQAKAAAIQPIVEGYAFDNPANFWEYMRPHLAGAPFLQCALDEAAHDLYGKLCDRPCQELWEMPNDGPLPKTSFTLSMDTTENLVEKVKSHRFEIYKIKLGTSDDLAVLAALRPHTKAVFRVDANCAWTAEEAVMNSIKMKNLGVEFMEQPLPAGDWEGMEKVYAGSALPVFADEACVGEADVGKCASSFHGINIKLMKCGGLTPALRMIKQARTLGLKVMCGCMVESSVGISAIAQLLPLLDYVDMDGPLFLKNNPARGARILNDGTIVLPASPGLGIHFLKA